MDREQRRERVYALTSNPFTREEIEEAQSALRSYLADYPEEWVRDIGHSLPYDYDYLLEREAQSKEMGLSPEEHQERERLLRAAHAANDLDDLAPARNALREWQCAYPGDPLVPRLLEMLESEEKFERELKAALAETESLQRIAA